jgi:hypothetical protein
MSIAAIVGASVGGTVAVLVLAMAFGAFTFRFISRRRKEKEAQKANESEEGQTTQHQDIDRRPVSVVHNVPSNHNLWDHSQNDDITVRDSHLSELTATRPVELDSKSTS